MIHNLPMVSMASPALGLRGRYIVTSLNREIELGSAQLARRVRAAATGLEAWPSLGVRCSGALAETIFLPAQSTTDAEIGQN